MSSLQNFLSTATPKAATDLLEALSQVPEDKRHWSPNDKIRSAANLVAECAVLNGYTADMILTRTFGASAMSSYPAELAATEALRFEELSARLDASTQKVVAAITAVPDADLEVSIDMPWGPMTLAQILSYPYWNMTYHLGQANLLTYLMADWTYGSETATA